MNSFTTLYLGCGAAIRHEILRGFFHRENRILLRKSQIFDLDTLFCSLHYCKKKFKKPDLLVLWKNPLTIPCLNRMDTPVLYTILVGHDVALFSDLIGSLALGVAGEEPGELLGDDVGRGL